MAVLSNEDRQRIASGLMRYWSNLREPTLGVLKGDIKAAVDATDNWIDTNTAAYNTALPSSVRTNFSATQKALIFYAVAAFRVSKRFAISLLGDVD